MHRMKKIGLIGTTLILLATITLSTCKEEEEEIVQKIAKDFTEAYFNMNMKKASEYCTENLHAIMNFRYSNLSKEDIEFKRRSGKAEARVLKCYKKQYDDVTRVSIEIRNFVHIDYLNDSLKIIPCDTIEIVLAKGSDLKWHVKEPL